MGDAQFRQNEEGSEENLKNGKRLIETILIDWTAIAPYHMITQELNSTMCTTLKLN